MLFLGKAKTARVAADRAILRFVHGLQMVMDDKVADLRSISCPVLAIAGKDDEIATPASARVMDLCSSEDFEYVEVPGGHIGVIGGKSARTFVWEKTANWLRPRSGLSSRA